MKYRKFIATVLATSMVLGIVGCQKKEETSISGTEGSIEIVFESSETSAETVEEIVEETVEETTEETTEATTEETTKETTKETEGTAPTEKPGNGTPAPTPKPTQPAQPTPTPKPTYEKRDTPPQEAIDSMGVQKINIAGYGEAWVCFYDASSVNQQVNDHRASLGIPTLAIGDTSVAKTRAAEIGVNFSHTRPNGQSFSSVGTSGENITTNYYTDAFKGFLNSPNHKSNMEYEGFTKIACATAYVYKWTPRDDNSWGGYFDGIGSGTVMCFW